MRINTSRFGEIEIKEDSIVTMPDGMLGFSEIKQYVLVKHDEKSPFIWYQAVGEPGLAFVITDPFAFFPDYEVGLTEGDLEALDCVDTKDLVVFVVVVIPENAEQMTANLRGPIVINTSNRIGRQVVLTDDRYSPNQSLIQAIKDLAKNQ